MTMVKFYNNFILKNYYCHCSFEIIKYINIHILYLNKIWYVDNVGFKLCFVQYSVPSLAHDGRRSGDYTLLWTRILNIYCYLNYQQTGSFQYYLVAPLTYQPKLSSLAALGKPFTSIFPKNILL